MNEDIKILREALAEFTAAGPIGISGFWRACDPDRIRRILDDAECTLDLELALRNVSYMNHVARELADELDSAGVRVQLGMIRDEINRALEVNT